MTETMLKTKIAPITQHVRIFHSR